MEKINEIKLPEGVDRIAVKQHEDKIVIEFIPEEPKFKKGDFVYEDGRIMIVKSYPKMYHAKAYSEHSNQVLYNSQYGLNFSEPTFRLATEEEKQILIDVMKKGGKRWNAEAMEIEDIPQSRFKIGDKVRIKMGVSIGTNTCDELILTVSEYHEQCHDLLYCKGFPYLFHEDWLEPYSEELKKGDLAIFWDNEHLKPLICLYHGKSQVGRRHFDNFGTAWDNAVKWDGTKEQFEKISGVE